MIFSKVSQDEGGQNILITILMSLLIMITAFLSYSWFLGYDRNSIVLRRR